MLGQTKTHALDNVVGRLMVGGRLFSLFIFEACIGVDVSYFQVKFV